MKPNKKDLQALQAKALKKVKKSGEIQFVRLDGKRMGVSTILSPEVPLADIINAIHGVYEDMVKFYESTDPDVSCGQYVQHIKSKKLN